MLVRASVFLFVVLLRQLDSCVGDNTSNASNATYYIQYDHGIEVATYDGGSTSHRFRRRLDVIQSANQTLTNANSIVQAVIEMGESLKKNIDTVLADLNAVQTQGLTLDSGYNTLHDAQAVIQNGLLLTTQVQSLFLASQPATTAIPIQNDPTNVLSDVLTTKRTLDSLVGDITSIGTSGLTVTAAAKVIANLQVAVQTGLVVAKDGIDIINAVQNIISTGVSIAEGQVIASAIQLVLQKGLANFDLQPKVCRRQASFRGSPSPLVNQCLASEDPLGPLCLPKCRTGYEPAGFDSCRRVGCAGGTSDLGQWCSKPPSYERNGYALWDQAKCIKEKGTGMCEQCALVWYPKCKPGFHAFGCFICTPDCPPGTIDDVAFCRKDAYFRGVSASRLGCPVGKQQSLFLCYPPCPSTHDGAGPLCSPKCRGDTPTNCGLFCASSTSACAASVVQIVGTGVHMALSAIASDFTGVLSSAVVLGKKVITMAPLDSGATSQQDAVVMTDSHATGYVLAEALDRNDSVSVHDICAWWIAEDKFDKLTAYLSSKFDAANVLERQNDVYRFRLLGSPQSLALSRVFSVVESAKTELSIQDYTVPQTTLGQIFNGFAAKQTQETGVARGLDVKKKRKAKKEPKSKQHDNYLAHRA
ncbi:hypothetical protein DYB37_004034 [Aphanomyces astaci]|uniref:Uncharacterized protein n=1 Tax=Aphanomyces astaci TaxID=112090 RepID=A0A3R6Y224_APHAT|nr:hypothetical protein DYB35_000468 [Aphanomyces astaci]RHZ17859.1 hypothetical protein DYB37_004034 [Aphanomyces astaci]